MCLSSKLSVFLTRIGISFSSMLTLGQVMMILTSGHVFVLLTQFLGILLFDIIISDGVYSHPDYSLINIIILASSSITIVIVVMISIIINMIVSIVSTNHVMQYNADNVLLYTPLSALTRYLQSDILSALLHILS